MPPFLALVLWFGAFLWLLRHDTAASGKVSAALWVPLIWMFIVGSRGPSQWLGQTGRTVATAFEEGNPVDRTIYLALIVLALAILLKRRLDWSAVLTRNFMLVSLLLFSLVSVAWSDFPFVAFKRWIRDLGMYAIVLVILTDPRPIEAISTVLRRLLYLLIVLSVVLIKYYRDLGVVYNAWTGAPEFSGVATSKNTLGVICLISGLFCFWDTLRRWPDRRARGTRRLLLVNAALMVMTIWLLDLAQSATSRVCLVIGCLIIAVVQSRWGQAHRGRITTMIPLVLVAGLFLDFTFDISDLVAQLLGRDPTFTGRTEIWTELLNVQTNPLIGVGYESFWLGDRMLAIWARLGVTFLNQAHNGYLETYLNLGLVGLALLGLFLIASYHEIRRRLSVSLHFASLSLALWTIIVFYNVTEAAFHLSLMWCVFLLCVIAVARPVADPVPGATPLGDRGAIPNARRV